MITFQKIKYKISLAVSGYEESKLSVGHIQKAQNVT